MTYPDNLPGEDDRPAACQAEADPAWRPSGGKLTRLALWMREEPRVSEVRAEMVANVWKVVASEGDQVSDGDTLVILESMKMEIPVLAEVTGTLMALHVGEGDVVQEGDLIAVIE